MSRKRVNFARNQAGKLGVFVAVLILFAGLFLGGYLVLKTKVGSADVASQLESALEKTGLKQDPNADDDGDGLKNWEEENYRTDKNKDDTDGDGYLDGEEVLAGYDPAKKAPGDELAGGNAKTPRPLPQNLTKALTNQLAQGILEGKIKTIDPETGQTLKPEEFEKEAGIDEAIAQALGQQSDEFAMPKIANSELRISAASKRIDLAAYFSEMSKILNKIEKTEKPELEIFAEAIEKTDFAELEKYQQSYVEAYQGMKNMTVPANATEIHKNMMGFLWIVNNIYSAVKTYEDDPLKTAVALIHYQNLGGEMKNIIVRGTELIKKTN
ncbi:MAG: hypothetical protein PHQ47_00015 [Candidatus Portnoybacteria bacterium]|nr:hypothetical protein [Candidatus Portnoybacteria bacterium]